VHLKVFDPARIARAAVAPSRLQVLAASLVSLLLLMTQAHAQPLTRSMLGATLGGSVDLGWREKLALQIKLGWSHEYADVGRPVAATLAGAPALPFTTYGISPTRDGVLLGLGANTAIAEATSICLRYEGTNAGQDSIQAITAGFRMTW
jgi:outer membrane autotransporter protein